LAWRLRRGHFALDGCARGCWWLASLG